MGDEEKITDRSAGRAPRQPVHPGAFIRRQLMPALEAKGFTKVALAEALQANHDLWQAERSPEVQRVERIAA